MRGTQGFKRVLFTTLKATKRRSQQVKINRDKSQKVNAPTREEQVGCFSNDLDK